MVVLAQLLQWKSTKTKFMISFINLFLIDTESSKINQINLSIKSKESQNSSTIIKYS